MATSKPPTVAPEESISAPLAKKPSPMRLVIVVVAVVLVAGLGAGGWLLLPRFMGKPTAAAAAPPAAVETAVKTTVPFGALVVNLNGEARRYLRVAVSLGLSSARDAKESKEVEEAKPKVLDLLIGVLSSAQAESLLSEDGRAELKELLVDRIHEELGLEKVSRIYFTEFVIQ